MSYNRQDRYGSTESWGIPIDNDRNKIPIIGLEPTDPEVDRFSYDIRMEYLPAGGELLDLSYYITALNINSDYINNVFPYIKVAVVLSGKDMTLLRNTHSDSRIILNMDRYKIKRADKNTGDQNEVYQYESSYMRSDSFKILDIEENPETLSDHESDVDVDNSNPYIECIITLYSIQQLNIGKVLNDRVYINNNMQNIVRSVLEKNHSGYQIIMYPPDNETIYEDVMIPPLSTRGTLEYLQDIYGIYKNGLLLWYDFGEKIIYVLDREIGIDKTTNTREFIWHNVKVEIMSERMAEPYDTNGYFVMPNEQIHRLRSVLPTAFQESKITEKELIGDTITMNGFTHTDKVISNRVRNGGNLQDYTPKEKYKWYEGSNLFVLNEMEKDLDRTNKIITQQFAAVPINLITPDRYYFFSFNEDSKRKVYDGLYKLHSNNIVLTKNGSATGFYIPTFNCTFSKIE